jgi:hypothetical protein
MTKSNPLNVDKLFEGSLQRLRAEAEYFSRLINHSSELGRINETHLAKLLRDYFPPKIGIGTGFVACGGDVRDQSPQCDIILYDAINNMPLYNSDAWSIFPIEMVYGVIEVKTTLNKEELEDAFVKCAKIRAMASFRNDEGNKAYILQVSSTSGVAKYGTYFSGLPPRFFVFAYSGWKTADSMLSAFKEISKVHASAHIHGVCSLRDDDSMLVWHNAHMKDVDRFSSIDSNGFRIFLMNLPAMLSSMLPLHRAGMGFDQVNIQHYSVPMDGASGVADDPARRT